MIRTISSEPDDKPLDDASCLYGMQPKISKYKTLFHLLFWNINSVPEAKIKLINDWQIRLPMVIGVLLIIVCPYIDYILYSVELQNHGFRQIFKITFFMIMYMMSYLVCIYEGPGYLPYYYPFKSTKPIRNQTEILKGVASQPAQKIHPLKAGDLDRCHYFKSVGRYIIRPDHFCAWTTSFIGRKNHKLFFLFNFWGVIYITSLAIYTVKSAIIYILDKDDFKYVHIFILAIFLTYGAVFIIMQVIFIFVCVKNFTLNETQYEQVKYENPPNYRKKGIIRNWEEIFGPVKKIYTWLIPIGAFHGMDPEDLLYSNHYYC
ncbi:DHHC zinc finger domain containing protein [Trichomonas vaginalis G3]|uniref:Palmitoyltransferase n=1 Tax=Trichomonas vaginalis (strain ATCC PRA-98 / G3) TaxID=412133 RepID=A2D7D1_TRIV3|nr:cysteine S-palmitoyltransferase protein [Trichomonas vaginalis G3]EAY23648.1 DHHC zinc finger domain containing protein [Trichomonas vaginalis G3]KAI5490140.1 cysteine S-palmitoyltransferase protein [Trichomonas vaginalis G3]|eukprot:XP_001276896.1 DHHC zinc finger domain containing protein [Trichomonas vaginalis G3]